MYGWTNLKQISPGKINIKIHQSLIIQRHAQCNFYDVEINSVQIFISTFPQIYS